jgi:hypothetical protein
MSLTGKHQRIGLVLRALVFESVKPRSANEQSFTPEKRIAFKEKQTIPDRTRVSACRTRGHLPHAIFAGQQQEGSRVRTKCAIAVAHVKSPVLLLRRIFVFADHPA